MAFTELFTETPGQTLYAFPAGASYALATWVTHRVLVPQVQPGLYSATCDDAKSSKWLVFVGATQPENFDAAIYELTKPVSIPALTGARTVTITVQLASVNVEGATVRISKAGDSDTKVTNASGQVVFSVDDGTWSVAITKSGMSFTPVSLVVDSNETVTYSMTAISITAPTIPGTSTGYAQCINAVGAPDANADCFVKLIKGPGSTGYIYSNPEARYRSDGSGLVEFLGLVQGATYRVWKSTNKAGYKEFVVPVSTNFAIPELV